MQVKEVLNKIVTDQPDALAVLVRHADFDYQNLKPPYDVMPAKEVLQIVGDVYDLTDVLAEEGYQFGDMILSFEEHSVVSRKLKDGAIVVLTRALARPQLIKLQVGLGLYTRALEKALVADNSDTPPETSASAAPAAAAAAPAPDAAATPAPEAAAKPEEPKKKKKVRFYRGVPYYD